MTETILNLDILAAMIRISTPVALAALGGILCHRAGIFNIALEGFMLTGSLAAIVVTEFSGGNVWAGLGGSVAAGMIMSLIFALAALKLKADQIMVGIGINLLAVGATSFILQTLFGSAGQFVPTHFNKIDPLRLPLIHDIPVFGELFGRHLPVTYLAMLLVAVTALILFRMPFGLAVRSLGENPSAALTAGIKPANIRLAALLYSGALAGLAGGHLSTGIVSSFTANMTQGRGFTAFTAIVFARANPFFTWLVSAFFGLAEAIAIRVEILQMAIAPSIVKMLPFILAILTLAISSGVAKSKKL